MSTKIYTLLTLFFFATLSMSKAQPYNTGIGLRLAGISSGITVKHFVNSNSALEGIVSFGRHAFLITGLYERHQPFPNAEGLSWFFGGGGHVGFFSDNYTYAYWHYKGKDKDKYYVFEHRDATTFIGADFILGLEYKFKNAPVDLGLDVKPFVDFVPGVYGYWEGALSVRFTL
jgi:hypothetical protein